MISIRSDISEKLNVPLGNGLIGKKLMFIPPNYPEKNYGVIDMVDNVFSIAGNCNARNDRYLGCRGPYAFFSENDHMGKRFFIDNVDQGKLVSMHRGIYKTDKGLSFKAEDYNPINYNNAEIYFKRNKS